MLNTRKCLRFRENERSCAENNHNTRTDNIEEDRRCTHQVNRNDILAFETCVRGNR